MVPVASGDSVARLWVEAVPRKSYFRSTDVPGSRLAVDSVLSRLAVDGGPVMRVRNGLYWKKPPATRFGTARPDPVAAALVVVGKGAGPSGWLAANALGLAMQVPARPTLAIVGRAPKGLLGVAFTSRSNLARLSLTPLEVAVLEVLRDLPRFSEVPWPDTVRRLRALGDDGIVDLNRVAEVACTEHRAGVRDRVRELLAA